MIELGQTVKDVITGYEGVVVSRHEYLYGCVRYVVQAALLKDGVPVADHTIDEQRLIVLDVPNIQERAPPSNYPGGDRPTPRLPEPPRY